MPYLLRYGKIEWVMKMEILQMRYFYETAQNENIAKTAEHFVVPASSVSASIKRLEKELGVTLFDRSSNRIKLNDKGYLLAESLREIFEKFENTLAKVTEKSPQPIEIRLLIKARRKWITDLIVEYKQSNPDVQVRIYNDIHMDDVDNFDIIVDEQSDAYEDLDRFPLSAEKICVKASKNSPLVGQALSFRQLRGQMFVMPRKAIGIRKLLMSTGKKYGFVPNITIECNDSYCLARYVTEDMGLTLGSRHALENSLEKDIVPLDITDFNEIQLVCVYHQRISENNAAIKDFCDFLYAKRQKFNTD